MSPAELSPLSPAAAGRLFDGPCAFYAASDDGAAAAVNKEAACACACAPMSVSECSDDVDALDTASFPAARCGGAPAITAGAAAAKEAGIDREALAAAARTSSGAPSSMDCAGHGGCDGDAGDDQCVPAASAARLPLDEFLAAAAAAAERKGACRDGDYDGAAAATAPAPLAALATPALPPSAAAVLATLGAARVSAGDAAGIKDAAAALIARWGHADTLYVYDLGEAARLVGMWRAALPRVEPFYAVKCNPEPGLMAMLAALGVGFDCASVPELEAAAALNAPRDRVIFANPCKRPQDIRYAAAHSVMYTTFDADGELDKIAAGCPGVKVVLRIRCDDETSKINLGLKYGADPDLDAPRLLARAASLGLTVAGVSFHVGSGCQNVGVYGEAIAAARRVFDTAAAMGLPPLELLDVGGGFTAPQDPATADLFYGTAAAINGALDAHFPPGCGVRVIAEPGRYFAETSATLFTTVLGARHYNAHGHGHGASASANITSHSSDYVLSDGTWGSFRIQVAVDGLAPRCSVLRSPLLPPPPRALGAARRPSRLLGDSGRGGDVVRARLALPALRPGDWLAFPAAGAYSVASASRFGGCAAAAPLKAFVLSAGAARDLGPRYATEAARAAAAVGMTYAPPLAEASPSPSPPSSSSSAGSGVAAMLVEEAVAAAVAAAAAAAECEDGGGAAMADCPAGLAAAVPVLVAA